MEDKRYRIHPAIGAARVGNADPDDFFIGPETPGVPANWDFDQQAFRAFKSGGRIKRQAARFHVWEYVRGPDGLFRPNRPVTLDDADVDAIEWTVHLANRKAAFFRFDGQEGFEDNFAKRGSDLRNPDIANEREQKLVIDPGPRSISGKDARGVVFENQKKPDIPIDGLGELRTDSAGRLLVLGGKGQSEAAPGSTGQLVEYANNDGWFDDVSDGPVTAKLRIRGPDGSAQELPVDPAWVVVGPPDFAPGIGNVVSLYEAMWDLAVREGAIRIPTDNSIYSDPDLTKGLGSLASQKREWETAQAITSYTPSFSSEIFPIFERAFAASYVHDAGKPFHVSLEDSHWAELAELPPDAGPAQDALNGRSQVFRMIRDPDSSDRDPKLMPKGFGDEYVGEEAAQNAKTYTSLTRVQYSLLRQWREGRFRADWNGTPLKPRIPDLHPAGLDRAAIEGVVGSPFFPGIEVSWLIRKPEIYSEPFRLRAGVQVGPTAVGPGFLTQQMALPWQADFFDCQKGETEQTGASRVFHMWWSAQRPDDVYESKTDRENGNKMVPWTRKFPEAADGENSLETGYHHMVALWSTLGFVVDEGDGNYFEVESN